MFPTNVKLSEDKKSVVIIDQTKLPNSEIFLTLSDKKEIFDAVFELKVRGAPAIGIFAGYALCVLANKIKTFDKNEFLSELLSLKEYVNSSRPTAVNLSWALNRVYEKAFFSKALSVSEILDIMYIEAEKIQAEDIEMCRKISEYGLSLMKDGDGVLTHCNAGPLATSLYGTGLGTLILGRERGYEFHAYVDETRPLLQGARLTSYELYNAGIDVTLICDNMAATVMKEGKINACFVGCDRVAANGDTANKIGTSGVAILAKYFNIPFYVFCPSSTIDFSCKTGKDIKIELRDSEEIKTKFFKEPVALEEIKCYNPAFDVTDSENITAIITEKGICRYPYDKSLKELFG